MEFPHEREVMQGLNILRKESPDAELIVLSEYTFEGLVPESVREWCRREGAYMIAGGKEFVDKERFYNTAFVIGPDGTDVFKQAKSVPIQFFADGLPAPDQKVWESPWGKIGIGICYDLSYREVMDRFVEQGAEALIIPTMDVQDWGMEQHDLHARVAPMRSMEYGIPIFRLASSGVSQLTQPTGVVTASASLPGAMETISGTFHLAGAGKVPVDRWFAPVATSLSIGLLFFLILEPVVLRMRQRVQANQFDQKGKGATALEC